MRNIVFAILILIVFSCKSNVPDGYISVIVKEVEQVGSYTYLLVKAKGPEYWIAVSSMDAHSNETYQYQGGLLMQNFYSKELDRTFDEILFLDNIIGSSETSAMKTKDVTPGSMVKIEKSDVSVEAIAGAVTIAELFANPGKYENKTIRVSGEVTKFNSAIMERNWTHIQDGTEHDGKFDLTITTVEVFEVGTTVTVEGVLKLNLDFGYGYSYEILLEKATVVK